MNSNPLLQPSVLPPYLAIRAEHVVPAITQVIENNLRQLATLLPEQLANPSFAGLLKPLEDMHQRLLAVQQPVNRLATDDHPDIAEQYQECAQRVVDYEMALQQNPALHGALLKLQASLEFGEFDRTQRAALELALREARLAGIGFDSKVRHRHLQLNHELDGLYRQYGANLARAQTSWSRHITDPLLLSGTSSAILSFMAENARQRGLEGWLLTLELPLVQALLRQLHDRSLREEVFKAHHAQATSGDENNTPVLQRILQARAELASLSGYAHYCARAQATRMFDGHADVGRLLDEMMSKIRPAALQELTRLNDLAQTLGAPPIEHWDLEYYRERYRRTYYGVADLAVRDYFPLTAVIQGLISLTHELFHVELTEIPAADAWHPDVRLFAFRDDGKLLGYVYMDLLGRPGKPPGAWMEALRDRHMAGDGTLQSPLALLSCDFIQGTPDHPTLMGLAELKLLLHEFGHVLHHVMTTVDHGSVAGIKGVADDAIEFPSSLFERWAMRPESLALFSAHYQTGDAIPGAYLQNALHADALSNASGLQVQLEYSLLDYRLHAHPGVFSPETVARQVLTQVEALPSPSYVHYIHAFAHLFVTADYAAGYYTYAWSQVLAAHLFQRFEHEGVLSPLAGDALRDLILAPGGTWPMLELIDRFIEGPPSINALLKEMGITP